MKYALVILMFVSLASCGDNRFHEKLAEIDSLLYDDSLDSAYKKFITIDTTSANGEADMAYYCLLKANILFRQEKVLLNDSIIDRSIAYYESVEDDDKLTQSYYYKGRNAYKRDDKKDAIELLKKAELRSKNTSNNLIKAKILGNLAYYNSLAGEQEKAVYYLKRAIVYSDKTNNYSFRIINYDNLGVCLGFLGQFDSARYYIKKCVPLIKHISDKEEKATIYSNLAAAYENVDDAKTEEYAKLSISQRPRANAYQILGNVYLRRGDVVSADNCWAKALAVCDRFSRKISILEDIARQRRKEERYKDVDNIMQKIILLRDSMAVQQKQDSIKRNAN